MAERVRYVANNAEFGRMIMSEGSRAVAVRVAREIAAVATVLATGSSVSGIYAAGFEVVPRGTLVIGGNPRAIAYVVNRTPYAQRIELGLIPGRPRRQGGTHGRPQRIMAQAAASVAE